MTAANAPTTMKGSRRTLLLVSLALNLFFICGIAAFSAHHFWEHGAIPPGGGPAYRFELLARRLAPNDANVLRAEFAKQADAIRQAHDALHSAKDAIRAALRAEPYASAATRATMAETKNAYLRLEDLLQDVIASAAEKMSPAGRAQLPGLQPGGRPVKSERK